jgi:NTE family protein
MRRLLLYPLVVAVLVGVGTPMPASAQRAQVPSTVGLALSGGSAKGIAHVGVIRALERLGVRVDVVAGTSMGSVVGGLYSMGLPIDSVESIIRSADWSTLFGDDVSRERRFLDQRRLDERAILAVPLEALRVMLPPGAIVGSNVLRLLESATWEAASVRSFAELPRPFVAVATDLETGDPVPLRGGVLSEAMRASIGIPTVLEPFTIGGRLLVDGAVSRNLPAQDARELGADFVICSDVSDPLDSAEDLQSLFDVFNQVTALSMLAATVEQRALCDVVIRPDVDGISSLAFEEVSDWVVRGDTAVTPHAERLRALAVDAPRRGGPPALSGSLGDSVQVAAVVIQGTDDPRVTQLVRDELAVDVGDFVTRGGMEERLEDLDATGLFHLVRYRLDASAAEPGTNLVVTVQEGARDRLGVGLRYDDEYRAALLFNAIFHSRLLHGSVTRLDLRVGEETRIAATLGRRRGVTGRLGVGLQASWEQGELRLPETSGGDQGVDIWTAVASLELAATRATALSLEVRRERAELAGLGDEDLVSVSLMLDYETLDRIDFPRSGSDTRGRLEVGADFTSAVYDARYFVPLHGRITLDVGVWLGYQSGEDVPLHRRFFLGGAHRSAVFSATHAPFQGLPPQEHSGRAAQMGRLGLRWQVTTNGYVRGGVDVGALREAWRFPLEHPMTGWALTAGTATLIGPVEVQLAKVWGDRHDPRLSVNVGRWF